MKDAAIRLITRGPALSVALAIAVLLIALAIVEAIGGQARPEPAPWDEYLKSMEDALAAGDAWLLRQAHWVALGSRRWEGMLEVGDAAVRAGNVTAARTAYLTAAYRARRLRSFEGILGAVEAFAALGDREVAEQWLGVAREFAQPSESARARVRAVADNLTGRTFATEPAR
jgi:hypothetical protein